MSLSPDPIFIQAAQQGASDVHMQVGSPIMFRIDKKLLPASEDALTHDTMVALTKVILGEQYTRFEQEKELDASYDIPGHIRMRINAMYTLGEPSIVARLIPAEIPTIEEADMEWLIDDLPLLQDGLLLFTGPTGAGKSTSMAAVISEIRSQRGVHVITLEDPIEFQFPHTENGIMRQRQFGEDFHNFPDAMRRVLRQDPDIVMVGEMRDLETISAALTLAETGHLVIGTLHTPNALQTVDRIIDVFPPHQQPQIRSQLSLSLKMIIAQRLVPKIGGGLTPLREVLVNTVAVANTIRENRVQELTSVMQMGGSKGMITFDKDAQRLLNQEVIDQDTYDEALGLINALNNK